MGLPHAVIRTGFQNAVHKVTMLKSGTPTHQSSQPNIRIIGVVCFALGLLCYAFGSLRYGIRGFCYAFSRFCYGLCLNKRLHLLGKALEFGRLLICDLSSGLELHTKQIASYTAILIDRLYNATAIILTGIQQTTVDMGKQLLVEIQLFPTHIKDIHRIEPCFALHRSIGYKSGCVLKSFSDYFRIHGSGIQLYMGILKASTCSRNHHRTIGNIFLTVKIHCTNTA